MICDVCGEREGSVQVLEYVAGMPRNLWVCGSCAAERRDLGTDAQSDLPGGEPVSLASFLGQSLDEAGQVQHIAPCAACGHEIGEFQESDLLGCPRCYDHFRGQLLPILARYHRHASHLGKVPQRAAGQANHQGEMTRLRIALEKSIRGEEYEEAARLRDRIRELGPAADVAGGADEPEQA